MKIKKEHQVSWSLTWRFATISFFSFFIPIIIVSALGIILYQFGKIEWLTPPVLLIICMFTSLTLGLIVSAYITNLQTRKANEMTKVMKKVANGDYTSKIPVPEKQDALYYPIAINFNKMVDELNSTAILQSDFASNFSHEFKTPIMSIKGYAEILQQVPTLSNEKKAEYLAIIIEETKRLAELASSTLLISKLDSIDHLENENPTKIDQQIEECVILLDNSLQKNNIIIDLDLTPGICEVNNSMFKEVWINLITNAIRYNKKDGSISIKSYIDKSNYIVEIKDTGIGISDEDKDRIFERYYQGEVSRISKGNGLGLPIVKRIIELEKGTIKVNSKLDEGSTFIVSIPLIK